jgi:hypothetical protein
MSIYSAPGVTMDVNDLKFKTYLGDGLYAGFDGWQIILWAPREDGTHYVALEPDVLKALIDYESRLRMSLTKATE